MFDYKHYVPILKGKEAEYGALQALASEVKAGLTPLIEPPPVPWDFENERPAKTTAQHLAGVGKKLATSWGTERPLFLDLCWIPEPDDEEEHPISAVLDDARSNGVKVIPVTGIARGRPYQEAIKKALAEDRLGICFRLDPEDFDGDLGDNLAALLAFFEIAANGADVIVDLGAILPGQATTLSLAAQAMINGLPRLEEWRTVTLAGSAFPTNLSPFRANSINTVERTEWAVWTELVSRPKRLKRSPTFGDYAIAHPEPGDDVDPRIMKMSVNLRYTAEDNWLIIKAQEAKRYGFAQFHQVCKALVRRPEYAGRDFSWGDQYIYECAQEETGPGNATTWRKVGNTHHLTLVIRQIASLFLP